MEFDIVPGQKGPELYQFTAMLNKTDYDLFSESTFDYSYALSTASSGPRETSPSEQTMSPKDSSPEEPAAASSSSDMSVAKVRRKPMPRKGHTKSRRGCFTCKKRKIKCQETLPRCENCLKSGAVCEYPRREISVSQQPGATGQGPVMQPQATPTIFTMNDMKYFHLFLTKAYPHLPVGADALWTLELPAQAHEVS
jgi:hypothetical protein